MSFRKNRSDLHETREDRKVAILTATVHTSSLYLLTWTYMLCALVRRCGAALGGLQRRRRYESSDFGVVSGNTHTHKHTHTHTHTCARTHTTARMLFLIPPSSLPHPPRTVGMCCAILLPGCSSTSTLSNRHLLPWQCSKKTLASNACALTLFQRSRQYGAQSAYRSQLTFTPHPHPLTPSPLTPSSLPPSPLHPLTPPPLLPSPSSLNPSLSSLTLIPHPFPSHPFTPHPSPLHPFTPHLHPSPLTPSPLTPHPHPFTPHLHFSPSPPQSPRGDVLAQLFLPCLSHQTVLAAVNAVLR